MCFGIPPALVDDGSYASILDRLSRENYTILNAMLIDLNPPQLTRLYEWVGTTTDLSTPGVWFILALEKDNAISRTKRLIGVSKKKNHAPAATLAFRGLKEECLADLYGPCHVSGSLRQSEQELTYFFGALYGTGDRIT